MVILLNELQDAHPPQKIHNEKRVANTNGLEIKGVDMVSKGGF